MREPALQIAPIIDQVENLFNESDTTTTRIVASLEVLEKKYGREVVRTALVVSHLTAAKRLRFAVPVGS